MKDIASYFFYLSKSKHTKNMTCITEAIGFFCSQRKDIEYQALNTGQEGLDRIRAENFDLILLDLGMPDLSGMDVLLSLKLDGLIKSRNIVVFTGSSNQDLVHELREMGVRDILCISLTLYEFLVIRERVVSIHLHYIPESYINHYDGSSLWVNVPSGLVSAKFERKMNPQKRKWI